MTQNHTMETHISQGIVYLLIITGLHIMATGSLLGCSAPDPVVDSETEDAVTIEEAPAEEAAPEEAAHADGEPASEEVSEDIDVSALPPITTLAAEDLEVMLVEARDADQVVVINFWATWCPPCLAEMPYFVQFYEEYDGDEVRFISITADHIDTLDSAIRPYQAQENLPFPIYILEGMDPAPYAEVVDFALTGALPVTLVYDSEGELTQSWEREIGFEDLEAAVEPLLG